jgi:ammonium transporter Rh
MLAGPVASSSTLLLATPWTSLLIGVVAGVLSTLSFTYFNAWFCGKIKVLDVMGVHNLHGVGGWISLLTGAMLAGSVVNVWAGVLTLALGVVAGLVTGLIIRALRGEMPDETLFSDEAVFEGYNPDPRIEPGEELPLAD